MTFDTLLGKSKHEGREDVTLVQHTLDVVEAAEALFGTPDQSTRLGQCWLRFFKLDPERDWMAFHCNLLAVCLLHDWGKANESMQRALVGKDAPPVFRHEHLSVLMLHCEGVRPWVSQRKDVAWDLVLAAVGSHHLKFSDAEFARPGENSTLVYCSHPDFQSLVTETAIRLNLEGRPTFPTPPYWGFESDAVTFNVRDLREKLRDKLLPHVTDVFRDDPRMLNALRSALITADAAGSGLRRTDQTITEWVSKQFVDTKLCDGAFVDGVIDARVEDLKRRQKWQNWNDFQIACDQLPSRSLLLAPCGSGKTLAAWRWIAAQAQRPVKRVLFLYPTRATATEGFKDYVSWAPEAAAALMHGNAEYDLEGMFNAEDSRKDKQFNRTDPRLFAIRHWSKQVFSATIDQFFAFLSYGYGPMCLLPILADSVIVVDEVHSFDRAMFSALLGFLKSFDVPVLCMTATLQNERKAQLADYMEVYEGRPGELKQIADAPRYRFTIGTEDHAEQVARRATAAGKRVIWVVNQVSRAQGIAVRLRDLGAPVICYHSRFKLDDRVERHRDTIGAIRAGEAAAIAVTTQVCEMSLDIDADVLISEFCPISSAIQRAGRCRRGRDELAVKGPGEVLFYKPAEEKVYGPEQLQGLDEFLAFATAKSAVSQTDLEEGLQRFGVLPAEAPKLNSFLSSGAYAMAGVDSLRDIDEFNDQAVLDNEIDAYLTANKSKQPGFIVPVPKKLKATDDPRLPNYLRQGNHRHYDARTGYWDEPLQ